MKTGDEEYKELCDVSTTLANLLNGREYRARVPHIQVLLAVKLLQIYVM